MWHFPYVPGPGTPHNPPVQAEPESICRVQVVSSHLTKPGALFQGGGHCIPDMEPKALLTAQYGSAVTARGRRFFTAGQHDTVLIYF